MAFCFHLNANAIKGISSKVLISPSKVFYLHPFPRKLFYAVHKYIKAKNTFNYQAMNPLNLLTLYFTI